MKRKIYKSKRLVLRPFRLSDFAAWKTSYQLAGPPQTVWDDLGKKPKRLTRNEFLKLVRKHKKAEREDYMYFWGIFLKASGEYLGSIDIFPIQRKFLNKANLGYSIFSQHRKKGYATEALRALIPRIFKDIGFHRFEASIDLKNTASQKLAKSAGLTKDGVRKLYWKNEKGKWIDQVVYIAVPELFR